MTLKQAEFDKTRHFLGVFLISKPLFICESSYSFYSVQNMKIELDPAKLETWPKGLINAARLDAQTEADLVAQQARDDATAMQDALQNAGVDFSVTFDITQKHSNSIG